LAGYLKYDILSSKKVKGRLSSLKNNWKLLSTTVGFVMIGASMFYPEKRWLIIVGALLFVIGYLRKPKKG